jgi:hypothetical protein
LKAVDAGGVPVVPAGLHRVTADNFEPSKLKAVIGVTDRAWAGHNISEHIRFAAAGRTWTRAPEKLEIEIRLDSVVPLDGELIANLLNVRRLQTHGF